MIRWPPHKKRLSIMIKWMTAVNSGLAFAGSFPPGTSILVSDGNMTVDNSTIAPKFPMLDDLTNAASKMLLIADLKLTSNASLVIQRQLFTVSLSLPMTNGSFALLITGNTTLNDMSMLSFVLSTINVAGVPAAISAQQAAIAISGPITTPLMRAVLKMP